MKGILLSLLLLPGLVIAQNNSLPASGNVGIKTTSPSYPLQIGNFSTSNENKIVIPGTYNFERLSIGQDGNGASSLEFVNHVSTDGSFGVKMGASVDHYNRGLYITTADVATSYAGLVYNAAAPAIFVNLSNNVGIGTKTPNPAFKMDVEGTVGIKQSISIKSNGVNSTELLMYKETGGYNSIFSNAGGFGVYNSTSEKVSLFIGSNDNVGIGTSSPAYKLSVAGVIGAQKLKVTSQGWADFVFYPDYRLRSLNELEQFVKAHNHLPDIPSADEVAKEGIDVGDMNKKLLQKVEELTLYIIQQQKAIEELQTAMKQVQIDIK